MNKSKKQQNNVFLKYKILYLEIKVLLYKNITLDIVI